METYSNHHLVYGKSAGLHVRRGQTDFGRQSMPAWSIQLAFRIDECARQLDFNSGLRMHQPDRDVHRSLSNFAAMASKVSSGSVTSLKIDSMSSPEMTVKSFSNGTTNMPQRSIEAGLTVSSPV